MNARSETLVGALRPILTSLFLAGSSLTATAQLDDAPSSPPSTDTGETHALRETRSIVGSSHGVSPSAAGFVGGGDRYLVEFEAGTTRFTPALGSAAPRNLPLTLSLEGIRRGAASPFVSATERVPSVAGERVSYALGSGITERWDVTAEGVELSYRFPERPLGSGDLIVRLDVDTDLVPQGPAGPDGLLFHSPGLGGVHVGGVTGVDAAGRTAAGTLRLVEGDLELVLPSAFVDAAAYPLVLDPLIGSNIDISNSSFDDGDPDAAYEGTSGNYLVVWERQLSSTNAQVRGQRVSAAGALLGSTIFFTSGDSTVAVDPRVAAVGGNLHWVVVFQYAPNVFAVPNVVMVGVAADGSFGSQTSVSASASTQTDPVIGGTYASESFNCMVAWEENGDVLAQRVIAFDENPLPIGSEIQVEVDPPLNTAANPSISRSASEAGVWVVAWERISGVGTGVIWARAFDQSGVDVGGGLVRVSSSFAATDAAHPSVDGDGEFFVVAFEKEEPGGGPERDVVASSLRLTAGDLTVQAFDTVIENGAGDDEYFASVAWTGADAVVAYLDVDASAVNAYLKSIDPYGCLPCADEFLVDGTTTLDKRSVRLASAAHGGDPTQESKDVLAVYERYDDTLGHAHALGQLYAPVDSGVDVGAGTPQGGIHTNPCLEEDNANFTARLRDAPGGALTYLLVSDSSFGYGCGTGAIVPTFDASLQIFSTTTQSDGDASVAIPVPDGVGGAVVVSQFATVSPGGGCPLLSGFELSNAVITTVGF